MPLHRSLAEPILLGGAPRNVAILNGTLAAVVGLGLQLWLPGLALWLVGNSLAVWGVPEVPFHLDALLADSPLTTGLAPRLGEQHLRTLSVRGFPTSAWPGVLDDLNRLGFAYRWSTRFICLVVVNPSRTVG